MPNRILKESITTSETIDGLSDAEEAFFYRLLVVCDDYGRMDARPAILRARLYPLRADSTPLEQVAHRLAALARAGLVAIYERDEKTYLQVATWSAHQQIRAKHSKYPALDDTCQQLPADDCICPRNTRSEKREAIHDAPAREGESELCLLPEDETRKPVAQAKPSEEYPADFLELWRAYPKKDGKDAALATWKARRKAGLSAEDITRAVAAYVQKWEEDSGDPKFIKALSVFLGPGGWYKAFLEAEEDEGPSKPPPLSDKQKYLRDHPDVKP